MSDLAGAAQALGVPEALVKRSAEARAKATGATVDEILAAWAGGAPATAPAAAPEPSPAATAPATPPEAGTSGEAEAPAAEPVASPEPVTARRVSRVPAEPPVLVGRVERAGALVAGVIGLLILSVLLAIAAPAAPVASDGVRSSNLPFTGAALAGRSVYASQACGSCHTQMIRNIVADVGLGPVTLADTNQVLGYRRFGPDLAAVGRRLTDPSILSAILRGQGGHPVATGLTDAELAQLVAYLVESR